MCTGRRVRRRRRGRSGALTDREPLKCAPVAPLIGNVVYEIAAQTSECSVPETRRR
jgi:hypothetical protein